MSLAPGTRVGVYEVTALLGAGGMGEVYRARDPRLQRDVALKILPDVFAADPERLARFQREAQVLASLTHPNIGHIYGLEETESIRALVLELIEGPTLADRLAHGPMALAEGLAIARQIADALDAAHEHGVIHRDLKPANIKVQDDGTVKVLDFGLAKLTQASGTGPQTPELTGSPTMSAAFTGAGVILGTAAYMAPEQARGRAVDKRADIWAFGCVLFEMLTGKRAFDGADATKMIAAVVRAEADWTALPAATPPRLRALLKRCLEKDPRQRLRDIGDVRFELLDSALAAPTICRADGSCCFPPGEQNFQSRALRFRVSNGRSSRQDCGRARRTQRRDMCSSGTRRDSFRRCPFAKAPLSAVLLQFRSSTRFTGRACQQAASSRFLCRSQVRSYMRRVTSRSDRWYS